MRNGSVRRGVSSPRALSAKAVPSAAEPRNARRYMFPMSCSASAKCRAVYGLLQLVRQEPSRQLRRHVCRVPRVVTDVWELGIARVAADFFQGGDHVAGAIQEFGNVLVAAEGPAGNVLDGRRGLEIG